MTSCERSTPKFTLLSLPYSTNIAPEPIYSPISKADRCIIASSAWVR